MKTSSPRHINRGARTVLLSTMGGLLIVACSSGHPLSNAVLLSEEQVRQAVGSSGMVALDFPADLASFFVENGVNGPCTGGSFELPSDELVGRTFQDDSLAVVQLVVEADSEGEDLVSALSADLGVGCTLDTQLPDGGNFSGNRRLLDLEAVDAGAVGWTGFFETPDGPVTQTSTAAFYRAGRFVWLEFATLRPHEEAVLVELVRMATLP